MKFIDTSRKIQELERKQSKELSAKGLGIAGFFVEQV